VTCRASAIPDAIRIDVSNLHLNEGLHVKDLANLPEGVTIDADPETLLVHVTSRAPAAEPTPAEAEAVTQPEVIKPERREKEE
jgi:large subunit ribosomal protein L25